MRALISANLAYTVVDPVIAVEHGASQGDEVKKIFESFGMTPDTLPDIEGRPRVSLAERK